MRTISRLGLHIIDYFILLVCLLFSTSALGCSKGDVLNKANCGHIAVGTEQEFWREWISKNDDSTCPLRPFVLSYNQQGIDKFEKRIESLKRTDSEMLFMRINIDNGIYYYYYLAWNNGGQIAHSLEWASPNDPIAEKNLNEPSGDMVPLLDELSKHDVYVRTNDRTVLDGDSMYLSLRRKGRCNRLASYNPKVECKKQTRCDFPFLLLDQLFGKRVGAQNHD